MNKENFIKFLLTEYHKSSNNIVVFSKKVIDKNNFNEKEIIKLLYTLQDEEYIHIRNFSTNSDKISFKWEITLTEKCINYFTYKSKVEKQERIEHLRSLIPIIISILALFRPEITLLMEELMKRLK